MYIKIEDSNTIGLLGSYVDDCLLAGNETFGRYFRPTRGRFESKPAKWDNVEFIGVKIETKQTNDGKFFEISQRSHIEN